MSNDLNEYKSIFICFLFALPFVLMGIITLLCLILNKDDNF